MERYEFIIYSNGEIVKREEVLVNFEEIAECFDEEGATTLSDIESFVSDYVKNELLEKPDKYLNYYKIVEEIFKDVIKYLKEVCGFDPEEVEEDEDWGEEDEDWGEEDED